MDVVVRGGLGNQLFMLATGASLAKRAGDSLQIVDGWYRRDRHARKSLETRREFLLHRYPNVRDCYRIADPLRQLRAAGVVRAFNTLGLRAPGLVLEDSLGLAACRGHPRVAYGYFQNAMNFVTERTQLAELLTLDARDQEIVFQSFERLDLSAHDAVALHVRRGDHVEADRRGVMLSDVYIERALASLGVERQSVLVFSDSPEWCKQSQVFRETHIVDENDPVRALRMMQMCSGLVMSPSSLSWWAAWLGDSQDRRIVAPRPFIEPVNATWESNVQPSWLRLEATFVAGSNDGGTR